MVYYTSDKDAYKSNSDNHVDSKTKGHYLYYDSNSDGFYETIFILSPDEDGDEVYDVYSIAYNYDGRHEFVPYDILYACPLEFKDENSYGPGDNVIYTLGYQEIIVEGVQASISTVNLINTIYYKDASDRFVARDHIFEIYRLAPPEDYSQLFYFDVYNQVYGEAWNIYEETLWSDIWSQVGMITLAGAASATALAILTYVMLSGAIGLTKTGIGVIVGLIFAGIYFLLSWEEQERKRYFAEQFTKARTYYSVQSDRSEPVVVSQKSALDNDGSWEHYLGHPSAKYLPVSGGEPGNMYTGQVIVYPPVELRSSSFQIGTMLDIVNENDVGSLYDLMTYGSLFTNLDYFLLTSELPSLDTTPVLPTSIVGIVGALSSGLNSEGDLSYSFNSNTDRNSYYLRYRYNTLGFLEQEVDRLSGGEFNAIQPICINGRPGYVFTNDESEESMYTYTRPLSPLYQPIVISQEKYKDLEIPDAVLSVDVKCAGLDNTLGVDAYELSYSEITQGYKNKIPLSSAPFTYPITKISIDVLAPIEVASYLGDSSSIGITSILSQLGGEMFGVCSSIHEVSDDDYVVENGNLYFYKTIDEIVKSKIELGEIMATADDEEVFFRVHIHFKIVVPDTDSSPQDYPQDYYIPGYGRFFGDEFGDENYDKYGEIVLDTTSNNLARIALAQAIQYSISDYFGTFAIASAAAQAQAEMNYITQTTLWSTFISSLFLAPMYMIAGSSLVRQVLSIPFNMITELYEELYIDTLIEEITEKIVHSLGGDERTAAFWSSFICSFRESFLGPLSPDSDFSSQAQTEQALQQATNQNELSLEQTQQLTLDRIGRGQRQVEQSSFKSLFDTKRIVGIVLSLPGIFVGGLGLGLASILGDLAIDHFFNKLDRRQLDKDLKKLLNTRHELELQDAQNTAFEAREFLAKTVPSTPLVNPNPLYSFRTMMSGTEFESQIATIDQLILESEQVLEQRKENIEENQQQIDLLDMSSEIKNQLEEQMTNPLVDSQVYTMKSSEAIADEAFKWGDVISGFSIIDLTKYDIQSVEFRKTLFEASMIFSMRGLDAHKAKTIIAKYSNQFLAPGLAYQDTEGNWKVIDSTTKTLDIYEDVGYRFDSSSDGWLSDPNQQIELLYLEDLSGSDLDTYLAQKQKAGGLSEEFVALDLMYLTEEEYEFYHTQFGYYLKNNPQIIINEETVPIYRKCFELVKDITTSMRLTLQGFDTSNPNLISNTKDMMKKHWDTVFKSDSILRQFSNDRLRITYLTYVEGLFDKIFGDRFDRIQTQNDLQNFVEKFEDRLQFVVLDEILRRAGIDDSNLKDYKEFSLELDKLLEDGNEIADLYRMFSTSAGKNKFLDSLTECFLCDPQPGSTAKKLILNNRENYYGYVAEQGFLYTRLRPIVINLFKDVVSQLSDTEQRHLTDKIYSSVSYTPGDDKYSNIFGLHYDNIKFYGKPSNRFFDGGGILDLLILSASTHIKSTTFESLIEHDKVSKNKLVDGLCHDGISAMLVDVIKRLVNGEKIPESRLVRLVGSYAVDDGYGISKFSSGITLANVEFILNNFFTTNVLKTGDKLASHEIFLVRLAKRINSELKTNIKYINVINFEAALKNAIKDMLSYSQFQKKVIKDLISSGFTAKNYFYKQLTGGNGFSALINFLTENRNFNKIKFQDTNGQFRLNLVYEYNPHFKTTQALKVADFPSGKVYTFDLRSNDGVRRISDDSDLQKLLNRKNSDGLVVCQHPSYPDSIILIPSDRLNELKNTDIKIQIGSKHKGVVYYIFACDNAGNKLISKLDFSDQGIKIRPGSKWVEQFYEYNPAMEDGTMIGYESNFYAAYLFATGKDYSAVLQDTTVVLEHMDPYKDPLHNIRFKKESKSQKIIASSSKVENDFKDLMDLSPEVRNFIGEVSNIVAQFDIVYLPEASGAYNYESISELIVSKEFFEEDGGDIESVWDELNPSVDQLATLSTKLMGYSKQRQFYKTLHDILMAYSGNNELINDYISLQGHVTFDSKYSNKFTKDEFKAIEHMEEILPQIFSFKFYTFLKLGLINLYKAQGSVKFQPLVFNKAFLGLIMNNRRVKAISTKDFNPYSQDGFVASFSNIIGACIIFGHLTSVAVIGEGRRTIYTKAPDNILSSFTKDGNYQHHTNPLRYSTTYGADVKKFLDNYHIGGVKQDVRIRRNIIGKTAIMKGFSRFLADAMNPSVIRLAGIQLGIDAFQDNPEVWSEKMIIYEFFQIFEKLINPEKAAGQTYVRDPTLNLAQVYTGKQPIKLYKIAKDSLTGATSSFLKSDQFGKLPITYSTLTRYFGNDFHKIQPALYYREYNLRKILGRKDLSLSYLLTKEFVNKIRHLYNNLYTLFSNNYDNNEEIKATFHFEKSLGFGEKTRIQNALPENILNKFNDLIDGPYLGITLTKQNGEIVNEAEFRAYVVSIAFYLVMFNAFVFIGDKDSGYTLFASQRKIYNNDYITGLYSRNEEAKLSQTGEQVYNTWQAQWNQEDGKTVWNFEDCWPIFLLEDARELIKFFENTYGVRIQGLDK